MGTASPENGDGQKKCEKKGKSSFGRQHAVLFLFCGENVRVCVCCVIGTSDLIAMAVTL